MGNQVGRHCDEEEEEPEVRRPLLPRNPANVPGYDPDGDPPLSPRSASAASGQPQAPSTMDLESLDFAPVHSRIFATEQRMSAKMRKFYGYTGRTLAKWSCTLAIGIMIGSIAFLIEKFAELVCIHKMKLATLALRNHNLLLAFLYYIGWGAAVVIITSIIVIYYAPAAAGGGVTLVIANLNGIHIPNLQTFRTLCVKIFGTMCAVTSGLAVGPEGPLVHIGAAIATQFTSLSARASKLKPFNVSPEGVGPGELSPDAGAGHPSVWTRIRSLFTVSRHKPTHTPAAPAAPYEPPSPEPSAPPLRASPLSRELSFIGMTESSAALPRAAAPAAAPAPAPAPAPTPTLTPAPAAATSPQHRRQGSNYSRQQSLPVEFDHAPLPDSPLSSASPTSVRESPRGFPGNVLSTIGQEVEHIPVPPSHLPASSSPRHRVATPPSSQPVLPPKPRPPSLIVPAEDPVSSHTPHLTRSVTSPAFASDKTPGMRFDPMRFSRIRYLGEGEEAEENQELERRSGRSVVQRFFRWLRRPQIRALDFHNDLDRREFISAGAAAGLAAAFGAPVGGVLFSLEEASSFWSRKVMWRSLLCSTVACLMLSFLRGSGRLVNTGLLSFHGLRPELNIYDLPFFVATAAATGLLGCFFSWVHDLTGHFRIPPNMKFSRIVEAFLIILVTIVTVFAVPIFFGECLPQSEDWKADNYGYEFLCPQYEGKPKQYNDLATVFFSVPDESIKKLLELSMPHNATDVVPSQFTMRTLSIFTAVYFFLFELAYGMAMPGGLFMPSTIMGAAFGGLLGMIFGHYLPGWHIQPGHHALIGATAMLGGIFRGSISLVVIMVEGTGGIDFVFPIITAIVVSNYVAGHFGHMGAYESDLEKLSHVSFLHSEPPHGLAAIPAGDIMSHNVVGFDKVVRVSEVLYKLRRTQHNGFPVFTVDPGNSSQPRRLLIGLILRSQLMTLLEQRAFVSYRAATKGFSHQLLRHMDALSLKLPITAKEIILDRAMRVYHLFHHPADRHLSSLPQAVDNLKLDWVEKVAAQKNKQSVSGHGASHLETLNEEDGDESAGGTIDTEDLALDLRPFMNHAPVSVRRECSVHRVYIMFRALGLRHLPVIDAESRVVGIITRKDLANAARADHHRKATDKSILPFSMSMRNVQKVNLEEHISRIAHQGSQRNLYALP